MFVISMSVALAVAMAQQKNVAKVCDLMPPTYLRCEYLVEPQGIDSVNPRLTWLLDSKVRGAKQSAYQILVATEKSKLSLAQGDIWNSGKVLSSETVNIPFSGKDLKSNQKVFWQVRVWDNKGQAGPWSQVASWTMGILRPNDWRAKWISYRDVSPLHTDRKNLYLPPARYFKKEFAVSKNVTRATISYSALGLCEFHVNGKPITQNLFEPGWSDYTRRAYYRTQDITSMLKPGANAVGSLLLDGWYSGYVGYGLLVGYGPNKVGRYFYGKTPSLMAQLKIEYSDGSSDYVCTDGTWKVSSDGPVREADLIMGEAYDARNEDSGWCLPGRGGNWKWESAIPAEQNGSTMAVFADNRGNRNVDLGFKAPPVLKSYCAPPIVMKERLTTKSVHDQGKDSYIFDLGQNFAGTVTLKVSGNPGQKIQLRYGEMLKRDGSLMTENLRRARATDTYICKGSAGGEEWTPIHTYHGFQFVEVTGLGYKPNKDAITGIAIHNETPTSASFACSDPIMTKFWQNTVWTQRANFVEIPTDCPQRDERLGWMGDAQTYSKTAAYNTDISAFYTKWLDDVDEAQLPEGQYPDYCPYPMGHGDPGKNFGTGWTDAGIICPYTLYEMYGDVSVIKRHWRSMTNFMDWRQAVGTGFLGTSLGNPWGDWLNAGETTSIQFIDTCYYAYDAHLMSKMAAAAGIQGEAKKYSDLFEAVKAAFHKKYVNSEGLLTETSQSAYALALSLGLVSGDEATRFEAKLAQKVNERGVRMTTGFLGTRRILPALSTTGDHSDLAVQLFLSRRYPSWGYEVVNGANTVWERWDSFTKEHGFEGENGGQNAAMNSFSHYSFGAVMEWGFARLAGIDTIGAGFKHILIAPTVPRFTENANAKPLTSVTATYDSIRGQIVSLWQRRGNHLYFMVKIPANTKATIKLPCSANGLTESDVPIETVTSVKVVSKTPKVTTLSVGSGTYVFEGEF